MPRRNYRRGRRGRRFEGYGPDWVARMRWLLDQDRYRAGRSREDR